MYQQLPSLPGKNDKELTACRTSGKQQDGYGVDNKTKKVYENIPAKAWRTIDEKFPEIAEDTRNLRLGISADGVDVNTGNRHHSVWPVLTVIYNLPPWLCMKRKFINLSVLISRYPGNDIDVFLEPLVDDLHTLFETGVDTYDASTKDNFNLHAVVLWTINDYPALGTLCGCPYSGFKGCVVCGKDTNCVRLSASSKQSYVGHRRYLPYNHLFRKQKKAFNGQQEFLQAPIPMTGEQIYNEVKHIENKWGKGKRTNNNASENQEDTRGRGGKIQKQKRNTTEEEGSSSQVNGQNGVYWKKFNIWYRKLKYWRHNPVPHCIDFMHVEKNVAESIVRTLLHVSGKTKDGLNARLDLAELGVKPELFAMQDEDKTTLPPAGYTLTNAEKDSHFVKRYTTNSKDTKGYYSTSDNNNSDSYSTPQISTSEEIDYDSPEPPKSLLKWYHYLSDEYKDNGKFWGSKLGCNESDVKPSWKDIKKAKACMLAKAQASEASSKAKVEARGQDLWSEDTMTFAEEKIGKRKLRKIIDISSDSSDDKRWAAKKASAPVFYGSSTQGLLDAYGYNTIKEYLSWNYFPSTDNESTNMETTDKDCIVNSNSAMSKGKYVPVCKKNKPNVYSHVQVTGSVLGLPNVTTWDEIEKKNGSHEVNNLCR
ncbi:putative transposase-associated domain-containing protein [Tanacetum coccineum]